MPRLNYKPILPAKPRPICIVGAGSIVRDAHLPAYKLAGFPVHSITDLNFEASEKLAGQWGISRAVESLDSMLADAPANAVFDLALPPNLFADVLRILPQGSPVLLRKPMGETMEQARKILAICRGRRLVHLKFDNVWTYCHKSIYQPLWFLGRDQAGGLPLYGNAEVLLGPFAQR